MLHQSLSLLLLFASFLTPTHTQSIFNSLFPSTTTSAPTSTSSLLNALATGISSLGNIPPPPWMSTSAPTSMSDGTVVGTNNGGVVINTNPASNPTIGTFSLGTTHPFPSPSGNAFPSASGIPTPSFPLGTSNPGNLPAFPNTGVSPIGSGLPTVAPLGSNGPDAGSLSPAEAAIQVSTLLESSTCTSIIYTPALLLTNIINDTTYQFSMTINIHMIGNGNINGVEMNINRNRSLPWQYTTTMTVTNSSSTEHDYVAPLKMFSSINAGDVISYTFAIAYIDGTTTTTTTTTTNTCSTRIFATRIPTLPTSTISYFHQQQLMKQQQMIADGRDPYSVIAAYPGTNLPSASTAATLSGTKCLDSTSSGINIYFSSGTQMIIRIFLIQSDVEDISITSMYVHLKRSDDVMSPTTEFIAWDTHLAMTKTGDGIWECVAYSYPISVWQSLSYQFTLMRASGACDTERNWYLSDASNARQLATTTTVTNVGSNYIQVRPVVSS